MAVSEEESKKSEFAVKFSRSLGAVVKTDGVCFRLFSQHAERVKLLLFDEETSAAPSLEKEMTHGKDDVWQVTVPGIRERQLYLYSVDGEERLLDPYALAVCDPREWGSVTGLLSGRGVSREYFPKCVVMSRQGRVDMHNRPRIPLREMIVYEAHLRGYTRASSNLPTPGTYAAIAEKIPYLNSLGVTTLELLPIHEFNEMEFYIEGGARAELRNFWGYSTVSFFAPNSKYAASGGRGGQVAEFREMAHALHEAGIELILDVVFNHTAESASQIYSFRGIDEEVYYMLDERGANRNFSGCGNTFNCNHPVVQDIIVDCLRYWFAEMGVDGFRFDLGAVFYRGMDGNPMKSPPLLERILNDPVLSEAKLIAEPWDAAGLYKLGKFDGERWAEWNDRFRDDLRLFWRGDSNRTHAFIVRVGGSADLYGDLGWRKSLNYLTSHDGFTLRDLVSHSKKHNLANCEGNRDGNNHNHSMNFGVEGATDDTAVLGERLRMQKNLLATLFLSRGIPMLLAGDEFGRTQAGNNNAYCQDNAISWVDWGLMEENAELCKFTREIIEFRKRHPILAGPPDENVSVEWCAESGHTLNPDSKALALVMRPARGEHILVLFNAATITENFKIPAAPGCSWRLALQTSSARPIECCADTGIDIPAVSLAVFVA